MTKDEFYEHCARLLDTHHEYREPPPIPKCPRYDGTYRNTYKTRYIGREPGNGRFAGCGIVRHYGTTIHVALNNPPLVGIYASVADALTAIEQTVYKTAAAKAHAAAKEVVRRAGVGPDPRIAAKRRE